MRNFEIWALEAHTSYGVWRHGEHRAGRDHILISVISMNGKGYQQQQQHRQQHHRHPAGSMPEWTSPHRSSHFRRCSSSPASWRRFLSAWCFCCVSRWPCGSSASPPSSGTMMPAGMETVELYYPRLQGFRQHPCCIKVASLAYGHTGNQPKGVFQSINLDKRCVQANAKRRSFNPFKNLNRLFEFLW